MLVSCWKFVSICLDVLLLRKCRDHCPEGILKYNDNSNYGLVNFFKTRPFHEWFSFLTKIHEQSMNPV